MEQGDYAVFNCSCSCRVKLTHTLFWFVGDLPVNQRTFLRGRTATFIERSGLYVEVSDQSTCERDGLDQGKAVEQLRINASSAMLYNRTAVQCVAFAALEGDQSFFSLYGLMLINAPGEPNATRTLHVAANMALLQVDVAACTYVGSPLACNHSLIKPAFPQQIMTKFI